MSLCRRDGAAFERRHGARAEAIPDRDLATQLPVPLVFATHRHMLLRLRSVIKRLLGEWAGAKVT